MFQFRRFPTYAYLIQRRLLEYCSSGFPHSVISGSKPMCGSPKLIAACHDLHRLLMPRHSPCALISLTSWADFCPLIVQSNNNWFSLESCRLQSLFEVFYHITACCCFTHFSKRFPPSRSKFHNFLLYSVACSSSWMLHCSVFKVQLPTC